MSERDDDLQEFMASFEALWADTNTALNRIADALEQPAGAVSATLEIFNLKGELLMAKTLQVGQTAQAVFTEWSGPAGTGGKIAPVGAVSFVSDDPTVATVDPSTGLVTAVAVSKKDATGSVIPVKITATDAGNGLFASDVVSDTPLLAQSATLVIT